jgi:folate-dependent phosphoribosylglycinamide formyltransferase PurN
MWMKDDDSKGTSVHKVTLKSHQNPIFAEAAPRKKYDTTNTSQQRVETDRGEARESITIGT